MQSLHKHSNGQTEEWDLNKRQVAVNLLMTTRDPDMHRKQTDAQQAVNFMTYSQQHALNSHPSMLLNYPLIIKYTATFTDADLYG